MGKEKAFELLEEDAEKNIRFLIKVRDSEEGWSSGDRLRASITLAQKFLHGLPDKKEEEEDFGQTIIRMRRERGLPV